MKKMWYILGAIAVLVCAFLVFVMNGMGAIKNMQIKDVDLSKVADGRHEGSFHQGRWPFDVAVTTKDHKITGVEVLNANAPKMGAGWVDKATAKIVETQTPRIDTVSGATVTTKALLKAVENALTK